MLEEVLGFLLAVMVVFGFIFFRVTGSLWTQCDSNRRATCKNAAWLKKIGEKIHGISSHFCSLAGAAEEFLSQVSLVADGLRKTK